jgi:hypothetical protein
MPEMISALQIDRTAATVQEKLANEPEARRERNVRSIDPLKKRINLHQLTGYQ